MPRRARWRAWSRSPSTIQAKLPFAESAEQRERAFKRSIALFTTLAITGLIAGTATGRNTALMIVKKGQVLVERFVGLPHDRSADEREILAERLKNAASARQSLAKMTTPHSAMEKFLQAAGMDARSALIRWGNVDRSIVLSSAVFEPDDRRAYRLKPGVRSIWVVGVSLRDAVAMFLVPDTPEARDSAGPVGGVVVPESVQTTSSWGCRGPEPDVTAPVRVIVLGDSMMQGALVGDQDTPPARLEGILARALKTRVSVLNTGHIGYSLEQYDQTLRAFGDRFDPHYVIISVSQNDFADLNDPATWSEGEAWLERIADLCRSKSWPFLFVPAADEFAVLGAKNLDKFQGQFCRIMKYGAINYVDPMPVFTDALLRLKNDAERGGSSVRDPLYNLHLLGDRHYSPLGSDLWARIVARRMLLTWDRLVLLGIPCPEAVVLHARSTKAWIPSTESAG